MKGEGDSCRVREREKIGKLPMMIESSLKDTEEGLTHTHTYTLPGTAKTHTHTHQLDKSGDWLRFTASPTV